VKVAQLDTTQTFTSIVFFFRVFSQQQKTCYSFKKENQILEENKMGKKREKVFPLSLTF